MDSTKQTLSDRPEFLDTHGVYRIYGLKRGLLYNLTKAGRVKSVTLRERNRLKGKRLWVNDSLAEYFAGLTEGKK
jgi:hypothetical protein